jgi:hypothetical protein
MPILAHCIGCIRLWDIRKAAENADNGTIIAEMDFDIGHFSLGDTFQGEQTLVVYVLVVRLLSPVDLTSNSGDSGGVVSFFDRKACRTGSSGHLCEL